MISIDPPCVRATCLTMSNVGESMKMVCVQEPAGLTPEPGASTSMLTAPAWSVRTTCSRIDTEAPSTVAVAPFTSGMIRTVARPFSPPGIVPVKVQYGAAILSLLRLFGPVEQGVHLGVCLGAVDAIDLRADGSLDGLDGRVVSLLRGVTPDSVLLSTDHGPACKATPKGKVFPPHSEAAARA